ncbi:MAG: hypothetical protein ACK4MQ_03030 [Hyphomonas sp.]
MLIAFATGIATLACNGCVSGEAAYDAAVTPAAERSLGMTLAVPGHLGSGPINAPMVDAASMGVSAADASQAGVIAHLTSPGSPLTVVAVSGPNPNAAFSLTGGGVAGEPVSQSNFAWGSSPALSRVAAELATSRYGQPQEIARDMSLGLSIAAPSERTGLGFDVSVEPRLAIRDEGDLSAQRFGGEVRFGQSLGLGRKDGEPEGWYFFVGADGEALVWDNTRAIPSIGDMFDVQLTDQITVGDLQAGLSIQRAGGEFSLSYIRREVKFDDRNRSLKDTEDFAGVTFTMRR